MNISPRKILFIFGTRPEAIKLAPVLKYLENEPDFKVMTCVTAQHREMLDQVLSFFHIKPDYDLNLMQPGQDLFNLTAAMLIALKKVIEEVKPNLIIVHGDTTSTLVGALAGFYSRTKVAHIEAGLRSADKTSPFPEEVNRTLAAHITDYHFVPTALAAQNLMKENLTKEVHIVGNTVVDALFLGLDIIKRGSEKEYYETFKYLDFNKKIILVTTHRRESFGQPLRDICAALKELSNKYSDLQLVLPVHPNPEVKGPLEEELTNINNIFLVPPLDYPNLIWLLEKSYLVITDSGGIQEEAPSLGKPVLVTRNVTERMEGIEAGTAKLVGTDITMIVSEVESLLNDAEYYNKMSKATNPYGDGHSAKYIAQILRELDNI